MAKAAAAGAKAGVKKKKKIQAEAHGVAHVKATFNNLMITLTDMRGNTLSWATAGKMGFKGSRKNTPFAAQVSAESAAKEAFDMGLRKVDVLIKGPGSGREAAVRALELKLDRLQAVDAVETLEAAYGFYVDKSLPDAISALFAPNSTLEILGRGVFIGLDRNYEYMRRLSAPAQGSMFNHMPLQPVVHVSADGNIAHARARLLVMFGATGRAAPP